MTSAGRVFEAAGGTEAEGASLKAGNDVAATHSDSAGTTSCVDRFTNSGIGLSQRARDSAVDFCCIFALMMPISSRPLRQQMYDYTSKEKAKITAGAVTALVIVGWLAVIAFAFLFSA